MVRLLTFITIATLFAGTCFSQIQLEGHWRGFWVREGDSLQVQFDFKKSPGGYSGVFRSDQLRVTDIPISGIRTLLSTVHFDIVGDATTTVFDGEVQGDSLLGDFRDGEAKGTFFFSRQLKPPSEIPEEEVTFVNGAVTLSGTLILPGTAGPYPAIVFVQGSGAEGRWASRFLGMQFARNGIASLIFDKRGVGKSTGDWCTSGFEDLAGDVCAGVAFLRAHPEIDSRRIGIHGHSQGGAIDPLIASLCKVAFIVGSAAPGLPMDELEIYSVENSINISSLPSQDSSDAAAYVWELVAVAYKSKERTQLDSLTTILGNRPWFFQPPPQDNNYWKLSLRIGTYNPISYWKEVQKQDG